ncbi:MAG: hypothetical protein NC082_03305 [Clostridiales bacterium]|nr:hypothetical protein [Clostridiales bacterium]
MNTLHYMLAIAATATITLASCNNKAKESANAGQDLENLVEENSVTVKNNTLNDTTLIVDGKAMKFAEVSRIFNIDNTGQFYLSMRAIVPADSSLITNSIYATMIEYYNALGDPQLSCQPAAYTPAQLAKGMDEIGTRFKSYAAPFAADTITPGFMMNVDMRPVYGGKDYLTYAIYDDYYTGGAHGEVDTYFITLNATTGEPYTFDTLFDKTDREKLRGKLVEIIAKDKDQTVEDYLKSLNEYIMPSTPVTVANFPVYHVGVSELGYVFTYPKYTIAPGFEGCPAYVIPLDFVKAALPE